MTLSGVPRSDETAAEDRYRTWDAAYVLGALTAAERHEYQMHLEACPRCRTAVAELSGMPALLSKLDSEDVQALDDEEPEPPPLRPEVRDAVLAKVAWRRRRSRWLTSAAVAAAAAVLAIAVLVAVRPQTLGQDSSPEQAAGPVVEMTQVVPNPFNATITMSSYAWGTRIDMACTYGDWSGSPGDAPSELGMVVVGHDGSRTEAATWLGVASSTALPSANVPMSQDDIAAVQVVSTDTGAVLLEKQL